MRPCPKPPVKSALYTEVNREISRRYGKEYMIPATNNQRLPEAQWLLTLLATLNPDHAVFMKGYWNDKPLDSVTKSKYDHLM